MNYIELTIIKWLEENVRSIKGKDEEWWIILLNKT